MMINDPRTKRLKPAPAYPPIRARETEITVSCLRCSDYFTIEAVQYDNQLYVPPQGHLRGENGRPLKSWYQTDGKNIYHHCGGRLLVLSY